MLGLDEGAILEFDEEDMLGLDEDTILKVNDNDFGRVGEVVETLELDDREVLNLDGNSEPEK